MVGGYETSVPPYLRSPLGVHGHVLPRIGGEGKSRPLLTPVPRPLGAGMVTPVWRACVPPPPPPAAELVPHATLGY